jgi:hypothetical protein
MNKRISQEQFEIMLEVFLETNEGFVMIPPMIPQKEEWGYKDALEFMNSLFLPDKDVTKQ